MCEFCKISFKVNDYLFIFVLYREKNFYVKSLAVWRAWLFRKLSQHQTGQFLVSLLDI